MNGGHQGNMIESERLDAHQAATGTKARAWRLAHTTRLDVGFRALRVRNYRLYWFGQLISLTGTWMQTTAQAWLVYSFTHSAFALGLVTTLQFLPVMLLALFGGVIADRVSKRKLMLVTQTLSLVQAAVFGSLVASGLIQVWQIYILAVIQGCINAVNQPTQQAFVAELVNRDDRPNAVALNSMLFNGARIIGPAVAGLILARFGAALALYLNAASFIAVLVALLMMNPAQFYAKPLKLAEGSPIAQLMDGLRYTWRTPEVFAIMLLVGFIGTFGYNFSVVLPLLGGFVLHTDAAGFGILSAALGIGSFAGALSTAFAQKITMKRLLLGATAFSVLFCAVAVSTLMPLSEVLLVGLGFAGIVFTTSANTLLQLTVPDHLRGRVVSLYFLLFAGSTPVGAFLIGTLSDVLNVTDALLICGALCGIGVVLAVIYRRQTCMRATIQPQA